MAAMKEIRVRNVKNACPSELAHNVVGLEGWYVAFSDFSSYQVTSKKFDAAQVIALFVVDGLSVAFRMWQKLNRTIFARCRSANKPLK
jgi:hypothetical protein